jgi:hypothetical protein
MRQLFHRCKQMCFLDQLRSSSAPDLTLAIMAGVPKEAVDAYSAGTPGLTPGFYGFVIVIFCVCFWFLCCLFLSVFARLLDFADSLGLTALDSPFGTEVRFLTFFRLVM